MSVAVGRDEDTFGVERVDVVDQRRARGTPLPPRRASGEAADEARGLDRAVVRMRDRAVEATCRSARDVVEPLGLEAVLAQRLVLEPDALALLLVAGEAVAAGAPQRVAGELGHSVERLVRPAPERRRALRAVRLAGDVVAGGAAAEREAAVAAARALRDPARVVHADAQAGLGEAERGGAARHAGADDRDVDAAVELRCRAVAGSVPPASTDSRSATVHAVAHDDAPFQLELDERTRDLVGAEARLARELVGARGQELEERRALALRRLRLDAERGEDVGGARQRRSAELEQRVRPGATART